MTQQYAVGDKVRILNVDGIWLACERGYKNGDIAEVIRLAPKGQPFIPAKNGGKLVIARSELKHIEKVAEHMTKKFNVGDTVRIVSTKGQPLRGFSDGDIVTVTSIRFCEKRGEYRYTVEKNGGEQRGYGGNETFELANVKPTQDKPKKGARLSALEAQVAELTAKVEALEKAQKPTVKLADTAEVFIDGKSIGKVKAVEARVLSANEQRKAIIAEAKTFVMDLTARMNNGKNEAEGNGTFRLFKTKPEFHVNAEKRTVVALVKGANAGRLFEKAIAKCAPDDVFNADIGKAIALGRALGLDVKRFEQAVKPTEVVVGQTFKVTSRGAITGKVAQITRMHPSRDGVYGKAFKHTNDGGWLGAEQVTIIDDTDAQY